MKGEVRDFSLINTDGRWLIDSSFFEVKYDELARMAWVRQADSVDSKVALIGSGCTEEAITALYRDYAEVVINNPFDEAQFNADGIEAAVRYYLLLILDETRVGVLKKSLSYLTNMQFHGVIATSNLAAISPDKISDVKQRLTEAGLFKRLDFVEVTT